MKKLQGRSALVTGSTQGIGLAIARQLAHEWCSVTINGLEPRDKGHEIAAGVARETGARVQFSDANLATLPGVEALMDVARSGFGDPDIVVNNAVVRSRSPIEYFSVESWELALAVNLSAPFHTIRMALPAMKALGWGRIINMASIHSYIGSINRVDYATSKTGILGMTRAVAMETIETGITRNAICPGTVRTETTEAKVAVLMEEKGLSKVAAEAEFLARSQPARRFVEPERIAELVVFLCSDAGSDITGAEISVDLGWRIKP